MPRRVKMENWTWREGMKARARRPAGRRVWRQIYSEGQKDVRKIWDSNAANAYRERRDGVQGDKQTISRLTEAYLAVEPRKVRPRVGPERPGPAEYQSNEGWLDKMAPKPIKNIDRLWASL